MLWKQPPSIKIYEALGSIADERIEVRDNTAKVYSSSRKKFYDVSYDPQSRAIMANDNGSYWQGYLGYPAIAFLFKAGLIDYRPEYGNLLKDIAWKDINVRFKNDFVKTLEHILNNLVPEVRSDLEAYVQEIEGELNKTPWAILGKKVKPPSGY